MLQEAAENSFATLRFASAAKAVMDLTRLTAWLEAAPFQNHAEAEFFRKL
jgi:hypothetical protein